MLRGILFIREETKVNVTNVKESNIQKNPPFQEESYRQKECRNEKYRVPGM